jgi:hypothetical protein
MQRNETPIFGRIPQGATHWSIRKRGELSWDWCTFADREGVAQQEFPLTDLAVPLIRRRWGAGIYRVMFLSNAGGVRQVFGNGKVFELTGANQAGSPRPAGREPPENVAPQSATGSSPDAPATTAEHHDMVRALLLASEGHKSAKELFEALAVPTGIGLSSLFSFQERASERLEAIERRLVSLEQRLSAGASAPDPAPRPPSPDPWARVLDKLEAIEARMRPAAEPAPPARRSSPGPRRNASPAPR